MNRPPDLRLDEHRANELTSQSILVSYAMIAAIPILLWIVSQPLLGVAALTAGAGTLVATRRAWSVARCLRTCQRVAVELGRRRITITQPPHDDAC